MVEVAIAAFTTVMAMDADPNLPEQTFDTNELYTHVRKKLEEMVSDKADVDWMICHVTGKKRSELEHLTYIRHSKVEELTDMARRRQEGEPLWQIIGNADFYGYEIDINRNVLCPRPETEELVCEAVKYVTENSRVLDLCTGSGCIAIAIAKNCAGKRVQVTASDVSDAAIMLAKENANYNSVDITFIQSDLFSKIHGRFNLIVCNPPYIKTSEIPALQREVRDWEPRIALDGGEDGLDFYRRLAREISRYIAKGGMLMLEVGEGQAEEVLKLFEKRDYAMVVKDYQGVDRILKIAF